MKFWRSYCRALLLAVLVMATGGATPSVVSHDGATGELLMAESGLRPEVRLRKLHLVRPDLIQYPISFEVYC